MPEPETYALIVAGLGLVGWQARVGAATGRPARCHRADTARFDTSRIASHGVAMLATNGAAGLRRARTRSAAILALALAGGFAADAQAQGYNTLDGKAPIVIAHRGARAIGPSTRSRATGWRSSWAPTTSSPMSS